VGQKLPPREMELYKRCDEVLHYLWDPIGVAGAPGAHDGYHAYLPQVFGLVRDEADPDEIVAYLLEIEQKSMGLRPNPDAARAAVDALIEWRNWIWAYVS
jgi:hypothetical protein